MIPFLISATVLIAAVILLRQLFKNRISRRLQYALWLIVAIRLVLPVQLGTSPVSIDRSVPVKQVESAVTDTLREPVSGPSYTVIYTQVAEEYVSAGQNIQMPEIQTQVHAETTQRIKAPTFGEIANRVWLVGAVLMGAWFLFVNLRFRHTLRKYSSEITVAECPIPVKVCGKLQSPCLSGFFRPTVYLTENCADDPQRLRHILAHELTHLRHGDLLWSAVRSILLCIYWFHPLVWVAAILSKRDCELACDEGALMRLGEDQRIAYGKTLLDTVARTPSPHHLLETATSMNETKKQLKERVNFIVKKPKFYLILTVCVLLIAAVAAACTFTGAPKPTLTPTEPTETTEPTQVTTIPTEPEETQPHDPRLFSDYQLSELKTVFTGFYNTRTNWYNAAMLATFDSPQDIDAFDLFSVGTGNPADRRLTDEELEYLRSTMPNMGPIPDQGSIPCRMSREYVENVLDQYFGLTTADLKTADSRFTYWEKTDCYYVVSEGHAALDFRLLGARRQEDGTVLMEYYNPYVISPKYIYQMSLQPYSGGYRILYNKVVKTSTLNPTAPLLNETPPAYPDLIAKFEALFHNEEGTTAYYSDWYADCLRPLFSTVEDLDVHWIFSMGPGVPDCSNLTDSEIAYLENFRGMRSNLDVDQPVFRIPRSYVEDVLEQYFGINPGEIEIESEQMVYWEETDCYYVAADYGGPSSIQILKLDVLTDGIIRFVYKSKDATSPVTYYEAILRTVPGGYQLISNLTIADLEVMNSASLAPDARPNPMNLLLRTTGRKSNAFHYVLGSVYEKPADVNIYEMLCSTGHVVTLEGEELQFAISNGLNPEISPISRCSADVIDQMLRQIFGIGLKNCNGVGLDQMVYNPTTDCYYWSVGGADGIVYTPKGMIQLEDGSVQIYYSGLADHQFRDMVVTLVPTETAWKIVSNVPLTDPSAFLDIPWYPAAPTNQQSYDAYFSRVHKYDDYDSLYVTRWYVTDKGTKGTLYYDDVSQPGFALCNDEDGFFIIAFDDDEHTPGKPTGYRRDDGLHLSTYEPPLEIIWEVPKAETNAKTDRFLTDGKYVYFVRNKNTILRQDLIRGDLVTLYKGDPILTESNDCMELHDQNVLFFLTKSGDCVNINRLYLPSMTLDVLRNDIPMTCFQGEFSLYIPDSNTLTWTTLNPDFFHRVMEVIEDPDSGAYNNTGKYVKYHDSFRGPNSIMNCTDIDAVTAHVDFVNLAQYIEMFEEIPSLLTYTYTLSNAKITETPRYWDPGMRE